MSSRTRAGEECLVIDPGISMPSTTLRQVFDDHHGLRPAAVLLTHGHMDHVFSVTPVCRGGGAAYLPAFIHTDDRYRLTDPVSLLRPQLEAMFGPAVRVPGMDRAGRRPHPHRWPIDQRRRC